MRRVLPLLFALGCTVSVDPDVHRYHCTTAADCGAGWDCKAQYAGGALCFKQGECVAKELCNGLDDDCDGRVDNGFDLTQDDANCGRCGAVCGAGTSCRASSCHETTCYDAVDNDSNGATDCADDTCRGLVCSTPGLSPARRCGVLWATDAGLAADGGRFVGSDGGADAGLAGCYAPETDCANGYDDDGDGLVDCNDPDCDGKTCGSGTSCANLSCPGPG